MKTLKARILFFCFLAVLLPSTLFAKDILIEKYVSIASEIDEVDIEFEFKQKNLFQNNFIFRLTDAEGIFTSRINSELVFSSNNEPDTHSWLEFNVNLDEFVDGLLLKTKVNLLADEGHGNEIVTFARGPEIFEIIPFFNYYFNKRGVDDTYYCFGARRLLLMDADITVKMEATIGESYEAFEKKECAKLNCNMNFFLFETKIKTNFFLEKNFSENDDRSEGIGVIISLPL
jgi:hypothetical protein